MSWTKPPQHSDPLSPPARDLDSLSADAPSTPSAPAPLSVAIPLTPPHDTYRSLFKSSTIDSPSHSDSDSDSDSEFDSKSESGRKVDVPFSQISGCLLLMCI